MRDKGIYTVYLKPGGFKKQCDNAMHVLPILGRIPSYDDHVIYKQQVRHTHPLATFKPWLGKWSSSWIIVNCNQVFPGIDPFLKGDDFYKLSFPLISILSVKVFRFSTHVKRPNWTWFLLPLIGC